MVINATTTNDSTTVIDRRHTMTILAKIRSHVRIGMTMEDRRHEHVHKNPNKRTPMHRWNALEIDRIQRGRMPMIVTVLEPTAAITISKANALVRPISLTIPFHRWLVDWKKRSPGEVVQAAAPTRGIKQTVHHRNRTLPPLGRLHT